MDGIRDDIIRRLDFLKSNDEFKRVLNKPGVELFLGFRYCDVDYRALNDYDLVSFFEIAIRNDNYKKYKHYAR